MEENISLKLFINRDLALKYVLKMMVLKDCNIKKINIKY